ncbi:MULTISPECIES: hypothetical protein [Thermoprotei]|uniref:hypothetical protein n=1 Tax=Thermoprotei TaxID=183924 RepID=UPI00315E572D
MPRKSSGEKKEQLTADIVRLAEDAIFSASTMVNMAIYAILEAPQELYFGSHSEKNLNVLEKVVLDIEVEEGGRVIQKRVVKPYYSPTKQRGIERRAIAYSLVKTRSGLVPYYRYFNLGIDVTDTYSNGVPDPRDILTFLWGATWTRPTAYIRGRVGYGGGVAVQSTFERKQRNRVDYNIYEAVTKTSKEGGKSEEPEAGGEGYETAQTLWMKEYAEPHLLIPVTRHGMLLGVENYEPHAMAYAFLQGLALAGASTPKSISILEAYWLDGNRRDKAIVVDIGPWLLLEPVTVSPAIMSPVEVLNIFREKALKHGKNICNETEPEKVFDAFREKESPCAKTPVRLVGDTAYEFLKKLADEFVDKYLANIEQLNIPRVEKLKQYVQTSTST